jgi:tellurium resistance protein TerD
MPDIFDKQFDTKEIKLDENRVKKGDDINLTAKDPTLSRIVVGMGWNLNAFNTDQLDLDASCFLLDKDGKTRVDEDFIFYNNTTACEKAISHSGDSRTGAGEGDDEAILLNLHGIPYDVHRIMFVISVYQAREKEQNMGMVRDAYMRIVNGENMHEIVRYEFSADLVDRTEGAMLVGSLDREGPKWHFRPLGEFVQGALAEVARNYGIVVAQAE